MGALLEVLDLAFGDPDRSTTAESKIAALRQRNGPFAAYFAEFQRYAQDLDWNHSALKAALYKGLSEELKDKISDVLNTPAGYNEYA